jgi:hypothetical protein
MEKIISADARYRTDVPVVHHGRKVFESRVLRIFEPKRDDVTGDWRKLHEELHTLYPSPSIIRMIKFKQDDMGRACSTVRGEEEAN